MADFVIDILKFFFRFIFEIVFEWTGEILLFVLTLGKHKPRWNLYVEEKPAKFVIFTELSLWIGIAFWVAVIALSYKLFHQ